MCGINGILNFKDKNEAEKTVKEMNKVMAHRGPDNDSFFIDKNIALGHRRLSIIDLSDTANQPMVSNCGRYTLVFNGEIYNYKNLKKEITNYEYKTDSDSELVLASYINWKENCVNKFEGMFAFAIWDNKEQKLFIARDRMGIKPLYYSQKNEEFVFSSEMRSILKSGISSRKVKKSSVFDFLQYQTVHAPDTIVEDIFMLMPGNYLTVNKDDVKFTQYWKIDNQNYKNNDYSNKNTVKKNVKELLYKSVEKRMMSDVPFGAFLSGGIDSSIIVGMMSEISSQKVRTFSVTFNEEKYSEAKYAKIIAKKFNTEHTEIRLTPEDFLNELPNAIKSVDHPSGDGPNTYIVSKVTKNSGITMALSGLGGDELFAGYDVFTRLQKLENKQKIAKIPLPIRKFMGYGLTKVKPSVSSQKINELLRMKSWNFGELYKITRQLYSEKNAYNILNTNEIYKNRVSEISSEFSKIGNNFLSRVSYAEISTYMQNILLRDSDQMSMASSLELRVPFLDYQLAEYVFGIPDDIKYPHSPKKLLVDSVGFLPNEIVNRPKMGFVLPWENWLKNELFDFSNERINNLSARSFFNEKELKSLWDRFIKGDKLVNWARVWIFIVLENYIEENNLHF